MESNIHFVSENISFELDRQPQVRKWLEETAARHDRKIKELTYIFCSDNYLLEINRKELKHDFYTDIITFPYEYDPLHADCYISIDRVCDNANYYQHTFEDEIHRVIVHGMLHLLGYDDRTEAEKQRIRQAEEDALKNRTVIFAV